MPEKRAQHSTSGRNMTKDYDESDMKVVYNRGQWHSWNDVIHWLDDKGMNDNELAPGEVSHLKQDIGCLKKDGVRFTDDYHQAYQLAQQHCSHR